ncbi:MAG TPA: ATP-binding protein [Phenylobacterium sp.]|jgi:signal transduction histidine kinase/ActR/RegA family two-component response regulator|nr:ATP-binding protein [Phenylobacterium sp.]
MTQDSGSSRSVPVATFHVRVAGVGLITTIVVLVAACLTFMLQQWVVARAQSQLTSQSLAQITATTAGSALGRGDSADYMAPLSALSASRAVISATLSDPQGRTLASYRANPRPAGEADVVATPVRDGGRTVGRLTLAVAEPSLWSSLPKYIALSFILLFGGVGMAVFLARSLAGRVIAPVQRLSEAMHKVAAGGSFEPVEVKAQDELFRSLTASFNHLLAKLAEREDDLKAAMRELEQARDAANAANVLKTQFLANMSHEIRTPLNGVLAMAEVMAMGDLAEVQRDRLDVIRQSGNLLLAVLNDVLDLSKIEAGKLSLVIEDFELAPAMVAASEGFRVMGETKGLDFAFEVSEAAQGWWRGDADRLRQIVGNLLSNAVKFTPRGSVAAKVDVSPESGALTIVVADTGVGIAPEKLPTLFEKFTQADNSATRRFGGTGLGLAICRELTQMMGGAIKVETREGVGSTFSVELPLERGAPVEPATAAAETHDDGDLRLLAAEDNPTNRQVLQAVMDSLGIDIDIVPDGREAVEAWRIGGYDLILMDIQMPVMDGIAAAREIREIEAKEQRRRTPIVALTANALTHQIEEYLAAGMDGHVAKPIEIAKLYEAISATLTAAATGAAGRTAADPDVRAAG